MKNEIKQLLLENIGAWATENFPDATEEAMNALENRINNLAETIQHLHNIVLARELRANRR